MSEAAVCSAARIGCERVPDPTEITRHSVTVESRTPGTRGSPAVVEFERSFVRLRTGAAELDRSPIAAAHLERIDSETFNLTLRSGWVIRPENVVEFLVEAAPAFESKLRWRPGRTGRRVPTLVLHLALTSTILVVGLVMGRFQFDGSELITWLVAGLMLFVGLLWSRLWNLDQQPATAPEPAGLLHLESRASVDVRRTVSGNIDLMRELLGERLGEAGPEPANTWLPPITIVTGRRRSIHLLPVPLDATPTHSVLTQPVQRHTT